MHIVLASIVMTATAAAPAMPVKQYQEALKKHVAAVSAPMLEMLSSGRSKAVRKIVSRCRKHKAFVTCAATADQTACAIASGCVLRDKSEEKWMKPNQALMEKRYSAMTKFSESFKGWRRRFAIGTMNKLADQHNEMTAKVASDQAPGIEKLMVECNKSQGNPTPESVTCIYDHFEKIFTTSADSLDQRAEKLRSYVKKDLRERIDGFSDTPAKPVK